MGEPTERSLRKMDEIFNKCVIDPMGDGQSVGFDTGKLFHEGALALDAAREEERQGVVDLEAWVADLQSGLYINCVYCGHRYPPGTPDVSEVLYDHIKGCPKHPLSKALADLADTRRDVRELVAAARPVTTWLDYAQPEIESAGAEGFYYLPSDRIGRVAISATCKERLRTALANFPAEPEGGDDG